MPSPCVPKDLNDRIYFITCTTKNWYYIFDRHNRWKTLADSVKYCQKHKGLKVFAYVFMLNHIHLLVESPDVSGFLRDFKKHTSFELMKNMQKTEPTVAELFKGEGDKYSIWQKTNMPKLVETEKFFAQKKEYIEFNPVRKNYVELPEHWVHSSASSNSPIIIDDLWEE